MELDLQFKELNCCEAAETLVISHEETMETAIPEYCPDMTRIVDAVGQLKVREKKLSAGRLTVAGLVKVTVLYTSEESKGLRSMSLTVPFDCSVDDERLQGCRTVCVCGRLPLVEARAVTSRKIYVRVLPEFEVEGICERRKKICHDAEGEDSLHLHKKKLQVHMLTAVLEKEFPFNQECMPESGKGAPEDLLLDRVFLQVTGCQRISTKLVVKGEATVSLLYRTEQQMLQSCEAVLPFSQIVDGVDLPEAAVYQAEVWAIDNDVRMVRTEGGCAFGVSVRVGLLVRVYQQVDVEYIDDLFATRYQAKVQRQEIALQGCQPPQTLRREATQQLEFGRERPFACVTGVECGAVTASAEGAKTALRTNLRLKILYLDEAGAPVSTERVMEVETQVGELPQAVRVICAPPVMQMGTESCQIKIPVEFLIHQAKHHKLEAVSVVELQEQEKKEIPSLVLRRIGQGECLWDIAKQYGTDPQLICSVNQLEDETALPEGMLLIPKVR